MVGCGPPRRGLVHAELVVAVAGASTQQVEHAVDAARIAEQHEDELQDVADVGAVGREGLGSSWRLCGIVSGAVKACPTGRRGAACRARG